MESFAKDLLFFNIEKEGRGHTIYYLKYNYRTIQNILLGLEVAVSPVYNEIEYVSFYIGEKINRKNHGYNISYAGYSIKLIDEIFESTKEAIYYSDVVFETYLDDGILYFIDKKAMKDIIAYKKNKDNYILMDQNNKISWIIMKN